MKCLVGRYLSYSPSWSPNWKAAVSYSNSPVTMLFAYHHTYFLCPSPVCVPSSHIQSTTKCGSQTILHPKGLTSDKTDGFGKGRVSGQEKEKRELSDVTTEDISHIA